MAQASVPRVSKTPAVVTTTPSSASKILSLDHSRTGFRHFSRLAPTTSLTTMKFMYIPEKVSEFYYIDFIVIIEGEERLLGSDRGGRLEKWCRPQS